MVPINQVILGGDPLLGSSMVGNSLDEQLQLIEKYKQNLEAAKQLRQQVQPVQQPAQHRMIWDDIDAEINPMSDEQKSKEICERYRGVIPVSATPTDVYVAINSQYHDYVELFKSWFGDNVDQKIIESAIIFWFKDVDCKSRNKVVSYFKEY